jgi:hypothetical protein
MPIERPELIFQGFHRHDGIGGAVVLQVVSVYDGHQIIQTVFIGRSGGLPYDAFIGFAIPKHRIHFPVGTPKPGV